MVELENLFFFIFYENDFGNILRLLKCLEIRLKFGFGIDKKLMCIISINKIFNSKYFLIKIFMKLNNFIIDMNLYNFNFILLV